MKFSQNWWVIVALPFTFPATVGFFAAQPEEPSALNALGGSEVQSEVIEFQSSSDEPESKQPTLASKRDTTPVDVEIDRRFNELRRELLDDRAKTIDWWLAIIAIFLTFLAIIFPIAAFIGGRFSIKKINEIKEDAQGYLKEIKKRRDEAISLSEINAEVAGTNPDKASEAVESVQQNPESSLIDKVVVDSLLLQQQGKIEKAIEKWQGLAQFAEETDNDLAARAWVSVGYLLGIKEDPDFSSAIGAYNKAIDLKSDYAGAYINRGNVYVHFKKYEKAFADFNKAIDLKPNYAEAYFNRGNLHADLEEHEKAFADYDDALRLKPNYAEVFYNRGTTKAELHRKDEARQDLERALYLALVTNKVELKKLVQSQLNNLDRGNT